MLGACAMIDRFYNLKLCIDKAFIKIGSDIKLCDLGCSELKELIDSLQPFKIPIDTFCRRNSTLLTAETLLKFL